MKNMKRSVQKSMISLGLSLVLVFQSVYTVYAAGEEIHLINDLNGYGGESSIEQQAQRDWNEDLLSVVKSSWYDTHRDDDRGRQTAASPSNIQTSGDSFDDCDENQARQSVEKVLKNADKDVISQSWDYLVRMLKEATIPKDAIPRETTLAKEIQALYGLNNEEVSVFHSGDYYVPQAGDFIFLGRMTDNTATSSSLATESGLDKGITRLSKRAVLGGIVAEDGSETGEIVFVYSTGRSGIEIGVLPSNAKEILGYAAIKVIHDSYCDIVEDEEEEEVKEPETEIMAVQPKTITAPLMNAATPGVYEVTFDYGSKVIWEENGYYHCYVETEDGTSESIYYSMTDAEAHAIQTVTYEVPIGEQLNKWVRFVSGAVSVNGTMMAMSGWENDAGDTLNSENSYWFVPEEDTVFTAEWSTELCEITFDYGISMAWEENGNYQVLQQGTSNRYDVAYYDHDTWLSAKENALSQVVYQVSAGKPFSIYLPFNSISFIHDADGNIRRLAGWNIEGGGYISVSDLHGFIPEQSVTLTADWETEFCEITVDYGAKVFWEEYGGYWYISSYGSKNYTESPEIAEENAMQIISLLVAKGKPLNMSFDYPEKVVSVGGTMKLMTGWCDNTGRNWSLGEESELIPIDDVQLTAQWTSDLNKISIDYGAKLIWEENGIYQYIDSEGWRGTTDEYEYAEEFGTQIATFYIIRGEMLNRSFEYPGTAIQVNGTMQLMTGWCDDKGNELVFGEEYTYIPEDDTVFTAQWADDLYRVAFDYGAKMAWEENGKYYSLQGDAHYIGTSTYPTLEEAQEHAVQTVVYYVIKGNPVGGMMYEPSTQVILDGQVKILSGWQGDNGDYVAREAITGYIPTGDVEFTAQWNSDLFAVSFDYGFKPIWQDNTGYYHSVGEYGADITSEDYSYVEENGVQNVTLYVAKGEPLLQWLAYPSDVIQKDGVLQKMTGWSGDSGETLTLEEVYGYTPTSNVAYTAQWSADLLKVTFDYGEKAVWSDGSGSYYYAEAGGIYCTEDYDYAEAQAVSSLTYYVVRGNALERYIPYVTDVVEKDGQTQLMTEWEGDDGSTLSLEYAYYYVPEQDVTYTVKWSSELYEVTFDYGQQMIWESSSGFGFITDAGGSGWAETREEAEIYAVQRVTRFIAKGNSFGISLSWPENALEREGTLQKMTGWKSDTGEEIELAFTASYIPVSDMVFCAQWTSELYKITFDYGSKVIWEENDAWWCLINSSNGISTTSFPTREEASDQAIQSGVYYVEKGNALETTPPSFYDAVIIGGSPKKIDGWEDQDGNYVVDLYYYTPQKDTVFTAQWSTELYDITFDFGTPFIWQYQYDDKYYILDASGFEQSFNTPKEAEEYAVQSLTRYISPGDSLPHIYFPYGIVKVGGTMQYLTGLQTDKGEFIDLDSINSYVPTESGRFEPVWSSDFYEITFDVGYKTVWVTDEDGYGSYKQDGNLIYPCYYTTRGEAEENAAQSVTFYVPKGDTLQYYPSYITKGVMKDGRIQMMNGWKDQNGNMYSFNDLYGYTPTKNTVFSLQWMTDVVAITVNYGRKVVYEDNGLFCSFIKDGTTGISTLYFDTLEEAEANASVSGTFYQKTGERLEVYIPAVGQVKAIDGRPMIMTGWMDDEGNILGLGDLMDFTPERSVTFTAQWSYDICNLTFDYGKKVIWEQNGLYYAIINGPYQRKTGAFETYEEAEANAVEQITYQAARGVQFRIMPYYFKQPVLINGTSQMIAAWIGSDGKALDVDRVHRFVPEGDMIFTADWATQFYNVSINYGTKVIWEENGEYWAIVQIEEKETDKDFFGDRETAEIYALETMSFLIPRGYKIGGYFDWTDQLIMKDGALQAMKEWKTAEGEFIPLENLRDYVPVKSVAITAQWTKDIAPVTGVKLNKSVLTLTAGQSESLTAAVEPSNAKVKDVTWSSSDTSVAAVTAAGKVTAVKAGTAMITVQTVDGGKIAKCQVTVKPATISVTGVNLNKTSLSLVMGKTEKLIATVVPSNASNKSISWKSSNTAVVTVASDGTVKAIKGGLATITVTTADGGKTASCKITVTAPVIKNGWYRENGKDFWYENNVKQGTIGRGKEIYDPGSDAWYWLDAVQGGAKAVSKEVYQESSGGKWVRYDAEGHMVKGWYKNEKGTYYYDLVTGAMTKGEKTIDKIPCYFDTITGIGHDGWRTSGGKNYWYEHGERQGTKYDKNGVKGDGTIRGREIFDPGSNAWYWLDAVYDGAKASSKEVWMPYIFQNENPKTEGKWVRYDANGGMIKGWYTVGIKKYYYDPTTGAMVKGKRVINGKAYYFDSMTGVLR